MHTGYSSLHSFQNISSDTKLHTPCSSISSDSPIAFDITVMKLSLFLASVMVYMFDLPPYLTVHFLTPFKILCSSFLLFHYKFPSVLLAFGYLILSLFSLKTCLTPLLVHVPIQRWLEKRVKVLCHCLRVIGFWRILIFLTLSLWFLNKKQMSYIGT